MNYKHVLFDVDGTLSDSIAMNFKAVDEALVVLRGTPATEEEKHNVFSMTLEQFFNGIPPEKREHCKRVLLESYARQPVPELYEGVPDVLKALKDAGIKMTVVTSRSSVELNYDKNFDAIAHYFDHFITCDKVKRPKPAPDSLLMYMSLTGALREEILYIGDSRADEGCAKDAGVDFALATWGALSDGIVAKYHPETIADILPLVFD